MLINSGALEIETVIVPDFWNDVVSNSDPNISKPDSSFSKPDSSFSKPDSSFSKPDPSFSHPVAQADALFLSNSNVYSPPNDDASFDPQDYIQSKNNINNELSEPRYSTSHLSYVDNEIIEPKDSNSIEIESDLSEPQDSKVLFNQLRKVISDHDNSISKEIVETQDSTIWVNAIANKPQDSTIRLNEPQDSTSDEDDNAIIEPEESNLRMRPSPKPILIDDDSNELDGEAQVNLGFL